MNSFYTVVKLLSILICIFGEIAFKQPLSKKYIVYYVQFTAWLGESMELTAVS